MLEKLMLKLEKKEIFNQSSFDKYDIDMLLDLRDEEAFDSEWMRVFYILEKKEIDDIIKHNIDCIRERAFLITYEFTNSSDIASCVSDDFEMICKAYTIGLEDEWLNALINAYVNHEFPCGKLKSVECNINDICEDLVK